MENKRDVSRDHIADKIEAISYLFWEGSEALEIFCDDGAAVRGLYWMLQEISEDLRLPDVQPWERREENEDENKDEDKKSGLHCAGS